MISAAKLKILHVARRQLGLDEDTYRDILRNFAGVESGRDLTDGKFAAVMDQLKRLGFKRKAPPRNAGALPTGKQRRMIAGLFKELAIDTPERRDGFCRRVVKHRYPLSRGEANKVIEALKAMVKRQKGEP
jgi:phage gp16-like protein